MKLLARYAIIISLILFPVFVRAQIDRTELNGTITDQSGATVGNAVVTVTQEGTNQRRVVMTDGHGQFVVSSLPIGRFYVVITHDGFKDLRIADLDLHSGDIRTVNAKLEIGEITQTIGVEADTGGAQLDKSNAAFGGTIQSVQISKIPLNGRNITNLELLAPGAIDSGSGAQSSIRFSGNGTDDNNFRLDGVDASGVFHASLKSALRLQFSTEAIAEFKVDSGAYTADTGGSAGGQVSLISKTGTNAFHGSVFDYLRNNYFDARGPIQSKNKRPVFQLNQFGGSLGGPVIKDRTFFFANYEGFRQQLGGVPQTGFVPSAAFRSELTAAQPALAFIVNAYPQGEAPTSDPNVDSFTGVVPSPDSENAGTARIDHRFSQQDSAYVRYNIDDGVSTSALNALAQGITVTSRVQNLVLEETHIINPRMINEVQFGLNRNTYIQSQQTGLPFNFSITGFTSLSENYTKEQVGQSESANDTVTWTKGYHTLKFGAEVKFPWFNEQNSVDGTAAYLNEAALLANQLSTFQTTAALPDKGMRKIHVAGYAQDEWKATENLTLNYGLRYNYFSPFHEVHNNEDPFDIADCGGYCGVGTSFYHPNYLSFDPRLSIAFAPASLKGKTVFRAGYGSYHGEVQLGDEDSPVVNTEPSTLLTSGVQSDGSIVQYSYPVPPALTPSTGLALTPRSMARHHPDSYVEQWTASVQQALPGQTVFTLTYLGAHGVHLFRRGYTNLINPATNTRPLPQYPSEIDTKYNEGGSNFNALVVSLNRRFHNGFFVAGNYMYSHALNDGSVGAGDADAAQNIACFSCDYATSDFDARHSGTFSAVYDLPFGHGQRYLASGTAADLIAGGWSVNTLLSARAGLPVNVTLSRSSTELPDGNNVDQRPDRVSGISLYPSGGRGISHWVNPAAFTLPAVGSWGNAGRNLMNGPPLWQDDSAVEKNFRITERNNVIFRAEAFNIFNRSQYGQPSSSLSVTTTKSGDRTLTVPASFGKITSTVNSAGLVGTGTPRVLEFSLRVTY
ncbi:TonB-dependent receptor [Paracidobacterium acidisoli]|uniref:TonB-dependent receptor n=1 Tax=Paracidobacterium acidisoli TaxID=2303751 RepID=A0A372IS15_9BACT|nr:carboxypeptidase regulatory-like domain-containing protein [Paracidobacterium acidisoli]MBT9330606.1 TonB-dependent receptor [Paracidobacterium acidisoli]